MLRVILTTWLMGILAGIVACGGGGGSSAGSGTNTPAAPDISFAEPVLVASVGNEGDAGGITAIKPMQEWLYVETQAGADAPRILWSNRDSTEFTALPFPGELGASALYDNRLYYPSNFPVSTRDVRDGLDTVTVYATDGTVHGSEPVWFMDSEFQGSNYPVYSTVPRRYDELYQAFTSLEFLPAADFLAYRLHMDARSLTWGLVLANEDKVSPSAILSQWSDFYVITPFVTHEEKHYYFVHQGGTDYGVWVGSLNVCDQDSVLRAGGCNYVFRDNWAPIKPMALLNGKAVVLGYEQQQAIRGELERNYPRRGWGVFSEDLESSSLEPLFLFNLKAYEPEDVISPAMEKLFDGSNFSVSGDALYFAINSDEAGQGRSRVYRSDGTEAGTSLLADIGYTVNRLLAAGDGVYCVVATTGGESLVYVAGLTGDAELLEGFPVFTKSGTIAANGSLIFPRRTQQYGNELWFIDAPTRTSDIVYDLVEGSVGSDPSALTKQGNDLYFTTGDSGELWRLRLD